jgi:hypothetical protein
MEHDHRARILSAVKVQMQAQPPMLDPDILDAGV